MDDAQAKMIEVYRKSLAGYQATVDRIRAETRVAAASLDGLDADAARRWRERLEALRAETLSVLDELESTMDSLSRSQFVTRVGAYWNAAQYVRCCNHESLIAEIDRALDAGEMQEPEATEAKNVLLCVAQGVTLGQYIESNDAASALAMFGEAQSA